ncbi:hypothetical protein IC757_02395 [Wenzhouxiangella sp. AB-CW3]|uniref:hypothetical protein n=1 Tax=Wenzhouxiangella sp. AB-CW3 TaxID=2771012 RepID=UPI00168AA8FA|nr:hypothetical protein [Wenzhouxiangella sp. AB-CW3]QOC23030.1 hypothetical protein IC757_02395 [Wenzhouxiangella sp. AB-CW3]
MMGQRKLAGYCLGGQEDRTVSSRMLEQSSRVFSSQADRLAGKPAAGAPDVGEKLVAIKTIWEAILNATQSDLDAPTATTLVELSDQLVTDTDQLLSMLVGQLDDADPFGRLVAESGRQRMLGQRTAALALCKRKGVTASLVEGKIGTIMADLEQSNRNLHAEVAVGKRVQRELDAAHTKLRHMKDLIASDQWTTHEMLETSDLFIDSMNRATSKLAEAGLRSI